MVDTKKKLVKTGMMITKEIWVSKNKYKRQKLESCSFLVLPDGLDKLEEMLKKELSDWYGIGYSYGMGYSKQEFIKYISSVFARFKKEQGLK